MGVRGGGGEKEEDVSPTPEAGFCFYVLANVPLYSSESYTETEPIDCTEIKTVNE